MTNGPPWNKHNGGECPVDRTETVHIRFRNGTTSGPHPASRWRWRLWQRGVEDYDYDIVEWRRA